MEGKGSKTEGEESGGKTKYVSIIGYLFHFLIRIG